jgi:hypothetical protein
MVRNHGFKEILIKINKPVNVAFEFDYQVEEMKESVVKNNDNNWNKYQ